MSSNSSISSLVSKKSDFLKKSENYENLRVNITQVNQSHRRRSNITYNQVMDPQIQEETKHKRRHSRKMMVKKSTKKLSVSSKN